MHDLLVQLTVSSEAEMVQDRSPPSGSPIFPSRFLSFQQLFIKQGAQDENPGNLMLDPYLNHLELNLTHPLHATHPTVPFHL